MKLELEEVTEDDDLAEEQGVGVSVESVESDDIVEKFSFGYFIFEFTTENGCACLAVCVINTPG